MRSGLDNLVATVFICLVTIQVCFKKEQDGWCNKSCLRVVIGSEFLCNVKIKFWRIFSDLNKGYKNFWCCVTLSACRQAERGTERRSWPAGGWLASNQTPIFLLYSFPHTGKFTTVNMQWERFSREEMLFVINTSPLYLENCSSFCEIVQFLNSAVPCCIIGSRTWSSEVEEIHQKAL